MRLILNCIISESARHEFDEKAVPSIVAAAAGEVEIVHLATCGSVPDGADHTHLLITGSELSASAQNDLDDVLFPAIRGFVARGRAVLGICYGHQVIATALAGPETCRPAARPEFGWQEVEFDPNPLFAGIDHLLPIHSHYDEVTNLPAGFDVIARTADCAVQAIQLRGQPVWGVQFHPEVQGESGRAMIEANLRSDPGIAEFVTRDEPGPRQQERNFRIVRNFFRTSVSPGSGSRQARRMAGPDRAREAPTCPH
jgi:GMP synthase-like glutamine amidotransferase